MIADVEHDAAQAAFGGRIHPLQLALDVQDAMADEMTGSSLMAVILISGLRLLLILLDTRAKN